MPPLPVVSGEQARRAFEHLGWKFLRQHGSHMILHKLGHNSVLSIPKHTDPGAGLPRSLIRDAEITVEEFLAAVR